MSADADETRTLHRVLFQDVEPTIGEALRKDDIAVVMDARLEPVPPMLRAVARDEIAKIVASVLGQDLMDVLTSGWQKLEQLLDAARRSLEEPGESEIVELEDHRISSIHRPHIDVIVDGEVVSSLAIELEIAIDVHAVTAVVSSGRLSAVRTGRADVAADAKIEGVQAAVATTQIDLAIEVPLGDGIPLVTPGPAVPPPPSPAIDPPTAG
jgi:hypothetical protein